MLRLAVPSLDETDVAAVAEVLRTGFLVQGRHVEAFEHAVATYTGALHAVAVSNCTSALHLSLLAIGIGPGDVVAVPAYSWPATINVVSLAGAEPAIVDVDPRAFNMDPSALESLLRARRVSAIMPVHAFGGMAQMVEIAALAADHGVPVVEDAACALGATLDGVQAGRRGLTGCFSFHPRKAITTGEGGVVVTDDEDVAMRLRALRNHGLDPEARAADFMLPGFNARMTEFQGALGLRQMEKLTRILASRRQLARRYDEVLAGTPVTPPLAIPGSTHAYQSYVVLLPESAADRRPQVIAGLRDAGFETTIGTYALPFIRYVREKYGFGATDFPNVASIEPRALSLPLHELVTDRDQERVVSCLLALIDQ